MQTTKERCIETIPVGPLGLIALDSHKELGKKVNDYLVSWRQERNHEHKNSLSFQGYERDSYRSEERRVGKECRSRWSPDH